MDTDVCLSVSQETISEEINVVGMYCFPFRLQKKINLGCILGQLTGLKSTLVKKSQKLEGLGRCSIKKRILSKALPRP